ncbi:MAG: hypothetical protein FWF95_00575 [Syntrophorhabdaceae bacterium]|nr:hypothetical protein [Syntrophorhabdaceae bacterium]
MENGNKDEPVKLWSSFRDSISYERSPIFCTVVSLLLVNLIPLLSFLVFDQDMFFVLAALFQFVAFMITGVVIGYWVECIPVLSYCIVAFVTHGRRVIDLFSGKDVVCWSVEFYVAIVMILLCYLLLVVFTYVGLMFKKNRLAKTAKNESGSTY